MSARRFTEEELAEARKLDRLLAEASRAGVALKRDGVEWIGLCPFHNETTASFRIYPDGHFHCFGCGAHGDAIAWRMRLYGETFVEAVEALLGRASARAEPATPAPVAAAQDTSPQWHPGLVPDDALPLVLARGRTRPIFNPKRAGTEREWTEFRPSLVHPYRDGDGALLGYVLRVDGREGKITPAVTYCSDRAGNRRWCLVSFAEPRPLYRLDDLAARSDANVVLVEGEKTADAAARLLPDLVAMTWPGGSKAFAKADWSPLAGRRVICVPDADGPGIEAFAGRADDFGERVPGILDLLVPICASLELVAPPDDLPDGWDLADAETEGWDGARAAAWLAEHARAVAADDLTARKSFAWDSFASSAVAGRARRRALARIAEHLLRRGVDPFLAAELVAAWNARRCLPALPDEDTSGVIEAAAAAQLDRERRRGR